MPVRTNRPVERVKTEKNIVEAGWEKATSGKKGERYVFVGLSQLMQELEGWRKLNRLSQEKMAVFCRTSRSYYSQLVRGSVGTKAISMATLQALVKSLGYAELLFPKLIGYEVS